jgi:nicotinate-nucleotide adenylyltransferase
LREFRVGVLGGTFNPIHLGHLHIAQEIQKLFSLTQVHFVVASAPPHKSLDGLIPFSHRYAMVSLATATNPSFIPSMVELETPSSPFSIDTMEKMESRFRRQKGIIYFIAGRDSLNDVKAWKESEKLLVSYNFIFAGRPGAAEIMYKDALPGRAASRVIDMAGISRRAIMRRLADQGRKKRIYIVDVGAPNISATQIRRLASSGKSIRQYVPGPVCEYLNKICLYGE